MLRAQTESPETQNFRRLISNFSDHIGEDKTPQAKLRLLDLFTRYLLDPVAQALTTRQEVMDHLYKYVSVTQKFGFQKTLTATNARLDETGDTVTLYVGQRKITLPEDDIGSSKKLLEVALCVTIRNELDFAYMTSFDQTSRIAEINEADPYGVESEAPLTSFPRYVKELNSETEAPVIDDYQNFHIDDLKEGEEEVITLPDDVEHISITAATKDDVKMLAALAIDGNKIMLIETSGREYAVKRMVTALGTTPHTLVGTDIAINLVRPKDLGTLVAGPEDIKKLGAKVDELTAMLSSGVLDINKDKLVEISETQRKNPRAADFARPPPRPENFVRQDNAPPVDTGNLPPMTKDQEKALTKILEAESGARTVLKGLGLDPKHMDRQELTAKFGDLPNGKLDLPGAVKEEMRKVVTSVNFVTTDYKTIIQLLAMAAERAVRRIHQIVNYPDCMVVALYHFGRSPSVFKYHKGFATKDGKYYMQH